MFFPFRSSSLYILRTGLDHFAACSGPVHKQTSQPAAHFENLQQVDFRASRGRPSVRRGGDSKSSPAPSADMTSLPPSTPSPSPPRRTPPIGRRPFGRIPLAGSPPPPPTPSPPGRRRRPDGHVTRRRCVHGPPTLEIRPRRLKPHIRRS